MYAAKYDLSQQNNLIICRFQCYTNWDSDGAGRQPTEVNKSCQNFADFGLPGVPHVANVS